MTGPEWESAKGSVLAALKSRQFDQIFKSFPHRAALLNHRQISVVVDVGANTGQFARKLRKLGYPGTIISMEPMTAEYKKLVSISSADPLWHCSQIAIGSSETEVEINIAGNSYSSSILPMLDRHVAGAPDSGYIGTEKVKMTTLDAILPYLAQHQERLYLKLDVQGYEMEVLKGAQQTLSYVDVIEMELSLVPLYEHSVLYDEMIAYLEPLGFDLLFIEGDFLDYTTGEVLQVNGLFLRR